MLDGSSFVLLVLIAGVDGFSSNGQKRCQFVCVFEQGAVYNGHLRASSSGSCSGVFLSHSATSEVMGEEESYGKGSYGRKFQK